jgi:GMP synthase (glutamine-hydrolysing)
MRRSGIAVINYGGQYAPQIGKFIRQQGVWTEMVLPNEQRKLLRDGYFENVLGIIHSGSRHSVYSPNAPLPDSEVLELQLPQFGYCYGQQAMQLVLGGEVIKGEKGEFGVSTLHVKDKTDIFKGLDDSEQVLMSHRDLVVKPASKHVMTGYTENSPYAALKSLNGRLFGVQFHPEVYQTPKGRDILNNFLNICGASKDWNPGDYIEEKIARIRQEAGDNSVIVLASGGKDSTTAALLVKKALKPEQTYYLHVETGLQRENEASNAEKMLKRARIDKNLFVVDASDILFAKLSGVTNDTQIRTIIGDTIYDVGDELAHNLGLTNYKFLQGTLTTDKVESSAITGIEDRIKVHHNVTQRSRMLVEEGRMIEPLDDFYKDDVKKLGPKAGTPQDVVEDEPMPGPGFGVRMGTLPNDFKYNPERFRKIEKRANEITLSYGLKSHVRPYYTVGVQGDERTTVHPAILEGEFDEKTFKELSKKLPDEMREISRVWYLIEPTKIESIEIIPGSFITRERVVALRKYEHATKKVIKGFQFKEYTQFPLYLMPDRINDEGELVVLRPFFSLDYMTGVSVWIPPLIRTEIIGAIRKAENELNLERSAIVLAGEGKPPGTTEAF